MRRYVPSLDAAMRQVLDSESDENEVILQRIAQKAVKVSKRVALTTASCRNYE